MATTKIITEVTDLNDASSTSGLKMPSGAAYSGATQDGMIRNDTDGDSQGSASTMQHFNGTDWKNYENLPNPITVDFLVVGGGGGGGDSALGNNGGGGAGGYKTTTTYSGSETPLTASLGTAYTVEVGPGGAINLNGTESKFGVVSSEIISSGGGKGGIAISPCDGGNGASGGGGATLNPTPAGSGGTAMPSGQGNNGGAASGSPSFSGGGGGGAGAVGGSANSAGPGNGGAGTSNNITGTNTPYAGGGGGASGDGFTSGQGTGGLGGGGIGVEYNTQRVATNGGLNTGGGGGGGIFRQGIYSAKSGGSGTVILRYPTANVSSYAVTGTLDTVADTAYPIANTAYYKLEGGSGTTVTDSSGNGNNGVSTSVTYAAGRFGQAAVFNGSSSSIVLGSAVIPSNNFSISMWVNSNNVSTQNNLITQYVFAGGSNGRFVFIIDGGYFQAYVESNGSGTNFNYVLSNNTWYHVTLVKSGSWECFVNGISVGTWSDTVNITTSYNTQLGSRVSSTNALNGSLDQVRIFSSALTPANVTSLYNEGTVNESTDGTDSILQFIGGTGTVTFS